MDQRARTDCHCNETDGSFPQVSWNRKSAKCNPLLLTAVVAGRVSELRDCRFAGVKCWLCTGQSTPVENVKNGERICSHRRAFLLKMGKTISGWSPRRSMEAADGRRRQGQEGRQRLWSVASGDAPVEADGRLAGRCRVPHRGGRAAGGRAGGGGTRRRVPWGQEPVFWCRRALAAGGGRNGVHRVSGADRPPVRQPPAFPHYPQGPVYA